MVGFSAPAAERRAIGVSLLLWPVRHDECLHLQDWTDVVVPSLAAHARGLRM